MKRVNALILLLTLFVIPIQPINVASQAISNTVSFQDGLLPSVSYTGTVDTYISETTPILSYGTSIILFVDGDDPPGSGKDLSTLLKWDISSIPADSIIDSVSITLKITNTTSNVYPIYALKHPWIESQTSWLSGINGSSWQLPGAQGINDRGTEALASVTVNSLGSYTFALNTTGVAVVQSWVADSSTNFGLIMGSSSLTDGLDFESSESSVPNSHPKLSIIYHTPDSVIPSITPSYPPQRAPKNTIIMVGDGMGFEAVKAANYYAYGVGGGLTFESFPYQGEVKTYSANSSVTDSAAAASAMATGQKVNNGVISMAFPGDGSELRTLLEEMQDAGKRTGLVTTSFLTDATPAGFGAHEPSRTNTSQIAGDYLTQSRPDIFLGGGGNGLTPLASNTAGYTTIVDATGLQSIELNNLAKVSGQFGNGQMAYEYDGIGSQPHLSQMAAAALDMLEEDPDGFFLLVEGGNIDHAAHSNSIQREIPEVIEFSNTVQLVENWASTHPDTLILVLADHETGGLSVLANNGLGVNPTVQYSTTGHTGVNIPIYGTGSHADEVCGVLENTEIRDVVYGRRSTCFPPGFTATPTQTATHTNTPQPTPTASFTPTNTISPTQTYTNTPTLTPSATPTPSPTPSATSEASTMAFQDGISPDRKYTGTIDTYLSKSAATVNYGRLNTLRVGVVSSTEANVILIRWDISSIPIGKQVRSAMIEMNVSTAGRQTYQLYQVLRNWSEYQATWNSPGKGITWQIPGATGTLDRGVSLLGSMTPTSNGLCTIDLNQDGIRLVQNWINRTTPNSGFILVSNPESEATILLSSESSNASIRPKLILKLEEIGRSQAATESAIEQDAIYLPAILQP